MHNEETENDKLEKAAHELAEYHFEYDLDQLQFSGEAAPDRDFVYDFHIKSSAHNSNEKLKKFLASWIAELSSMKISRKDTLIMFGLARGLIDQITDTNLSIIDDQDNKLSAQQVISTTTQIVQSEFHLYNNRYRFTKTVDSNSLYVHPEERAVGTRYEMKRDRDHNYAIPRLIQSTCQYVPITNTLHALFQSEEFRRLYFKYNTGKHQCLDGRYTNFCCGEVNKSNELFSNNPYAIQIQIATDDFDPCSALQSKAGVHKMCAIYFSIVNIPQRYRSKLDNIYLVCLCHSDDINKSKQADFNNLWRMVVEDVRHLETDGFVVGSKRIRGSVAWLSFDNLGANISLGFAGSFSAEYYCRFCECSYSECNVLDKEIVSKIRTQENYSARVAIIKNLTKVDYKLTFGVKRYCALNDLKFFHITTNISVDIFHDLNEGVILFLLKHLFDYLFELKVLSKDELINLVQFFDYGVLNQKNIPSILALKKDNLGQNGTQAKCLFIHIPFILWKFRDNAILHTVWNSVMSLLRISQIVYSSELSAHDLVSLEQEISSYLKSIKENFGCRLTPKHHNLTHYVRVIRSMGPVIHMNMIRFEAKHKVFKEIIHYSPNFKNICKTLAIRHQQNASLSGFNYADKITHGSKRLLTEEDCNDNADLQRILIANVPVFEIDYFCCNNYKYKKNFFLVNEKQLFQINRVFVIENKSFLLCTRYEYVEYVAFFNSYKIKRVFPLENKIIPFDSLTNQRPYECKNVQNESFIIADTLEINAS